MYSSQSQGKGGKGSVQFKNTKGRLQIVFSYPVEENGEIKRKRFYISTGYEDTPINRQRVGGIVSQLQRDIDYGEVDLSLQKYQPFAALSTVSRIPPIHQRSLNLIWVSCGNAILSLNARKSAQVRNWISHILIRVEYRALTIHTRQ